MELDGEGERERLMMMLVEAPVANSREDKVMLTAELSGWP